jgi:hypothetical protein
MEDIEQVKADFEATLRRTADELKEAGVGIVPSWAGDWKFLARELAEALQPPPIGAIQINVSGTAHRRGSGERATTNVGVLRRDYEPHLYGPPPGSLYGDGTRAVPGPTRQHGRHWLRSATGGLMSPLRRSPLRTCCRALRTASFVSWPEPG